MMGISDNEVPYQCHSLYFTLIETLLPIIWCDVSGSTPKEGVKERRISSIYALNFKTKSIPSDRAWVDLESSSIFFCVFLCFGYKITGKPLNPSDNLVHASNYTGCRPNLTNAHAGTKINGSPVAKGDHFCSRAPETSLLTRLCGDWKFSVVSWVQIQSQRRKVNLWRVLMKLKDTFCK